MALSFPDCYITLYGLYALEHDTNMDASLLSRYDISFTPLWISKNVKVCVCVFLMFNALYHCHYDDLKKCNHMMACFFPIQWKSVNVVLNLDDPTLMMCSTLCRQSSPGRHRATLRVHPALGACYCTALCHFHDDYAAFDGGSVSVASVVTNRVLCIL